MKFPGPGKQLHAPYTQAVDDDLLVIETSWPCTTIDGDPRIVADLLSVSRATGGGFLLNLSVCSPADRNSPRSPWGSVAGASWLQGAGGAGGRRGGQGE